MYYIGIDLHKQDLVMAVENERGPIGRPRRPSCRDVAAHLGHSMQAQARPRHAPASSRVSRAIQ